MRFFPILVAGACTCWIIGCKPAAPTASADAAVNNAAASGPVVPHPQFENWNQFEVGTKVVRKKVVSNDNGKVVETETLELIDKTDAKVVVQSQTLVERSNGVNDDNPPQSFEFAATFRLPPNLTIEQFKLPSLKAELKGEQSIEVVGKTYPAKVYEWTESNETGPMTVRLLWVDGFPGGKVSQEMHTLQTGMNSVENIHEAKIIQP